MEFDKLNEENRKLSEQLEWDKSDKFKHKTGPKRMSMTASDVLGWK